MLWEPPQPALSLITPVFRNSAHMDSFSPILLSSHLFVRCYLHTTEFFQGSPEALRNIFWPLGDVLSLLWTPKYTVFTVAPLYTKGIHSKTPSVCLKLQIVLNLTYSFFSFSFFYFISSCWTVGWSLSIDSMLFGMTGCHLLGHVSSSCLPPNLMPFPFWRRIYQALWL